MRYLFVTLFIACSLQLIGQEKITVENVKDGPSQSLEKIKAMYPGHVAHNQTQPVFHYNAEDRTQTIFEDVYIEVPCDTDGDGKRDLVKIKIIRPAESGIIINPSTGETAITLPVLMEHSPYRNVPSISSEARTTPFHNVRHEQQEADKDYMPVYEDIKTSKPRAAEWYFGDDAVAWNNAGKQWITGQNGDWAIPASRGDKPAVFQGVNTLTQSNPNPTYQYFLTRGYAIVISSSIGNTFNEDESEGLTNCGDVEETLVPMAIIKWLNGKVKGYTDRSVATEVKATWCNGNVAMTGQSYVGTLPQATACSGVEGLKAILPIAAISNWYDYYRAAGAVVAPYNYQGEDADVLIDVCYGPLMKEFYQDNVDGISDKYADWIAKVYQEQDRATGNYNEFWDKRNYLTTVDNVRDDCGIMIMHGLNDWNVKTKQPDQFYRALKNAGKTVKQVWHLGGHSTVWNRYDSHYLAYYHLWLDHFLYGLDNKAVERIPDISIPNANNVNWEFYDVWPIAGSARTRFFLSAPATANQAGGLLNAPLSGQSADSATFGDNYELNTDIRPGNAGDLTAWENRLFNPAAIDVHSTERLIFATEPLEKPLRINGTVTVTLELAANKGKGTISAVLVESGPNYRDFGTIPTDVVLNSGHGEANITLDNYIINNVLSQYKIVTRGYTDVQNPNPSRETYLNAPASNGYIPAFYYRTKQITPGQKYAYTFEMEPMDYTFKAGTRLALYVYSTDYRTTIIPEDVTGFTLYMNENSFVELPVVPTYSIFYHANGGSSLYDDIGGYSDAYPKEGQSVKAANFQAGGYRIVGGVGDSTVVKLNVRDSLTFRGWNTKADGSGISYMPNDRITDDQMSDLTLYAQWEETVELLTAEEKAFLALLDYNNADTLAQYLTKEIGNRYTSTFRRDMAVDWMMAELLSYGYAPYIHEFENNRYTNNGCFEADGRKYIYYGPAYNTETVYQFTNNTITLTQVEVLNWADVNNAFVIPGGVDVAGKAVIVTLSSVQAPNAAAAAVPDASNYYDACLALQNAGAKAVIFELPAPRNDWNTTYTRIPNTTTGTPVTIPVGVALHYEIYPMLNNLRNAKEVKLTMQTSNDGKNVLAVLPSATGSKKNVYITAHFDTTVSGPGMNDNASGTVMTLEMARAFKNIPFEYNIVFFLCDAEEAGLRGARAYCVDMADEERANFVADYNMDMIATSQEDCIHFFLNINDTTDAGTSRLRAIQNSLTDDQRLIEVSEAFALAKQRDVFNHTYLAAQKLNFDMDFFNICWDTTTDHWAFVQEATRSGNNYPNMMNAVEYDWRSNKKGTSFEALYHKAGDTYETNFSGIAPQGFPPTAPTPVPGLGMDRIKTVGDMVALSIFFSAKGSMKSVE